MGEGWEGMSEAACPPEDSVVVPRSVYFSRLSKNGCEGPGSKSC